ncbi:MAG: polysaccharide deacetylase family protein, partial [Boseongicola sp.]|nr:polysaccharide deacetylase family protein [Boseongicola sp.]
MKSPKKTVGERSAKPVFYDPTSRRLVFFTVFSLMFVVLAVVWFSLFFVHLYRSELPPGTAGEPHATTQPPSEVSPPNSFGTPPEPETARQEDARKPEVHAFIPYWSMAGLAETRANIDIVDVLLPEWFSVDGASGDIVDLPANHREKLKDVWLRNRERVSLLPIVRVGLNEGDKRPDWLNSATQHSAVVAKATSLVTKQELDGLCLDFSRAPANDVDAIVAFSLALRDELTRAGQESCLVLSIHDPLIEHPRAAELADRLIVLAFREPGPLSIPSPLAGQGWYEQRLSVLLSKLLAEKLVIAIGSFGMDWVSGQPNPEYLNFFDVTEAVALHGGEIDVDRESLNSAVSFRDDQGRRHQIWLLDALSAHNQLKQLSFDQISGIAVWPVSGVDPGVWDLLSAGFPTPTAAPSALQHVRQAFHVRYTGKGPLLTVQNAAQTGQRLLETDSQSGLITGVNYVAIPRALTITQSGTLPENSVVLTFDDGPSRAYTPRILDILKQYQVPAVFFVVGSRVQLSPEIAQRIVEEGHE